MTDEELIKEILSMNITTLKKMAKEYKIENYTTMSKTDLINHILIEKGNDNGKIYGFGKLETFNDGYGFLRETTVEADIYISASQIRRFYMRNDDIIFGELRIPVGDEKNYGMIKVLLINGDLAEKSKERPIFDDLIPSYPN